MMTKPGMALHEDTQEIMTKLFASDAAVLIVDNLAKFPLVCWLL